MEANLSPDTLNTWLADVSGPDWLWYVKYLSANDTYAKANVHQAGPYLSKPLLATGFPELCYRSRRDRNPDYSIDVNIDSHGWQGDIRVVWYNSKVVEHRSNGRDEARLTGWGGRQNPLVEPNATGSLVVFAFNRVSPTSDPRELRIWITRSAVETDQIIGAIGEVEPGAGIIFSPTGADHESDSRRGSCDLTIADMPEPWLKKFPSGEEIVDWVLHNRDPWRRRDPDTRLMRRRDCEYDVFRSIERHHVLPRISHGFATVDSFIEYSNGVTNRRKSRAGRSLELQVKAVFDEENVEYSWTPRTEGARRPDFIFPSIERYLDHNWPSDRIFMLAAKTTCKDRWRQILNEAERIETKHLLTLQEGISLDQHAEMREEGVQLVVPAPLIRTYPESIRPSLLTVTQFMTVLASAHAAH